MVVLTLYVHQVQVSKKQLCRKAAVVLLLVCQIERTTLTVSTIIYTCRFKTITTIGTQFVPVDSQDFTLSALRDWAPKSGRPLSYPIFKNFCSSTRINYV